MYIRRQAILFLICLCGTFYGCRPKPAGPPSSGSSDATAPPVVKALQHLIDSGARWDGPQATQRLLQLKNNALQAGPVASGYYYYLEGMHYWYADSNQAAINSFTRMLPVKPLDTSQLTDLIILQQLGLLQVRLASKIDDSTFTRLFHLIALTEKYQYASSWRVYDLAAEVYYRFGDYDKAETYAAMARDSYPVADDYFRLSLFMEERSRIYERRHQYRQALQYQDSALQYALQQPDTIRLATVYSALGVLYEKTGDKPRGHALMEKAFNIKEKINKVSFQEYINYGQLYQEKKEYPLALHYLGKALEKARQANNSGNLSTAFDAIHQIYYDKGDYKTAILYLDSAADMALAEQEDRQLRKIVEIQALNELKVQQHKTLDLSRQYNNQAIIVRQQQVILLIIIILLVLGLLITFLLIRQRKLVTQKMNIELEQRLLRSQMEPHFIFNTLSVLQSFIRRDEKEKSVKYLNKFARLLRLNLENSRHNLVRLQQETEALENYLSLQSVRFDNLFGYTIIDIPPEESSGICIPPMLLQPFVENAIQHGMRNIAHRGHIAITLQLQGDLLHCVIEDNGQGLQPAKHKEKNSLSSIITQERLKILSIQTGKLASLTITDKASEGRTGVRVTLIIPTQRC
ncbi:tetratricopeptide repeat-containing sensor histidine kinase [Chitinophaga varians]|uniref:tetratricopeptide repeat-containing sensor histidine kinase n=1 Tax=Chitinophaga varians TaxID=2202339 RepID=UPI00165FA3F6|nr:histidine kinase [Chitinophaga varians]MBC9909588.1 histidine kinase [Chitinophaga varians]